MRGVQRAAERAASAGPRGERVAERGRHGRGGGKGQGRTRPSPVAVPRPARRPRPLPLDPARGVAAGRQVPPVGAGGAVGEEVGGAVRRQQRGGEEVVEGALLVGQDAQPVEQHVQLGRPHPGPLVDAAGRALQLGAGGAHLGGPPVPDPGAVRRGGGDLVPAPYHRAGLRGGCGERRPLHSARGQRGALRVPPPGGRAAAQPSGRGEHVQASTLGYVRMRTFCLQPILLYGIGAHWCRAVPAPAVPGTDRSVHPRRCRRLPCSPRGADSRRRAH